MRQFKIDLLSPYVSDAVAFLLLAASIAAIFGVANTTAGVNQPSDYQSFSYAEPIAAKV